MRGWPVRLSVPARAFRRRSSPLRRSSSVTSAPNVAALPRQADRSGAASATSARTPSGPPERGPTGCRLSESSRGSASRTAQNVPAGAERHHSELDDRGGTSAGNAVLAASRFRHRSRNTVARNPLLSPRVETDAATARTAVRYGRPSRSARGAAQFVTFAGHAGAPAPQAAWR